MTTRTLTANEQTIIAQQLQAWSAPKLSLLSNTPIIYSIKSPLKSSILSASIVLFLFCISLFFSKEKLGKNAIFNNRYILIVIVFLGIMSFIIYFTTNWKNNRIINALPHLPENATVSQYNSYIGGWFR
jgi:uncharacterized membrane protein